MATVTIRLPAVSKGYRTFARRLARDLVACIEVDDRAGIDGIDARKADRCFNRARKTCERFIEYELRQRALALRKRA